MAKLRDDVNEYGTPITVFVCEYCNREFSCCPAIPDDRLDNWRGCLATDCISYDPERDADKFFLEDGTLRPDIRLIRRDQFN